MKNCGRLAKSEVSRSARSRNRRVSRRIYLESIENDDYSTLPGGIFNKGFVKSYAKYVGIDEQEALQDYTKLDRRRTRRPKKTRSRPYRPEVLTDDRIGPFNGSDGNFRGGNPWL